MIMVCICDGRKWGAKYFEGLSKKVGEAEKAMCQDIAKLEDTMAYEQIKLLSLRFPNALSHLT